MSNSSASFWAQKPNKVLGADSALDPSTSVEAPAPHSPKKPGLVLKSTQASGNQIASKTNGISATPATAHSSWSDEVEAAMEATSKDNGCIDDRAPRTEELEANISELQSVVKEKNDLIREYFGKAEVKDARIAELEQENHAQLLHIKQLVAEVDDKDRRITDLETELDEKGARIHELELEASAHASAAMPKTPAWNHNVGEIDEEPIPTQLSSQLSVGDLAAPVAPPKVTPLETVPESVTAPPTNPAAEPTPAVTSPTLSAQSTPSTPAPRDWSEPLFITSVNVKKAPPVPPPPKLKLGIDMSKYGKQAESKAPVKPVMARRVVNTNVVPNINPNNDVRKMSRAEREPYGNGPTVTIKLGNTVLAAVPKYMFMQCSDIAFRHWQKNHDAKGIQFPEDSMDRPAAMMHIDWMLQHTHVGKVFSVHLEKTKPDRENLQIVRAARVLGLNNTYVGHFTKQYCDKIRQGMLPYDLIALIDEMAYPDNDPIFDCLANNLANQRQRGTLPNLDAFDKFLSSHPKLAAKIKTVENKFGNSRKPRQPRKGSAGTSEAFPYFTSGV